MEKQFRGVYEKALRRRGVTGETDAADFGDAPGQRRFSPRFCATPAPPRARWSATATSRSTAARSASRPIALKVNDVIDVKNNNVSRQLATKNLEVSASRAVPDWLSLNKEEFKGTVMRIPTRDEIQPIANEQAVVEFYSR